MATPGDRRLEFEYGHATFVQRAVLLFALWVLVTILFASLAQVDVVWVIVISAAVGAYAVVFGISPLLTQHWLTRSRLILRQGWYFRAILPLREVRSIRPYDGAAKVGLRGDLARGTLYVTGSKVGLVDLELATPRRFWQVLFVLADHVVFDVTSRDRFLEAAQSRAGLLAPVKADRAETDLRY